MLGNMHAESQIRKLVIKTTILSEDNTNANRTPFVMRPPATIRNSKKKLNPYEVLFAKLNMTKFTTHYKKIQGDFRLFRFVMA